MIACRKPKVNLYTSDGVSVLVLDVGKELSTKECGALEEYVWKRLDYYNIRDNIWIPPTFYGTGIAYKALCLLHPGILPHVQEVFFEAIEVIFA